MNHPIENFMDMTTDKIKQLIDVDTIVGQPIVTPDGRMIIPISKMTFGMVSGGGEYAVMKDDPVSAAQDGVAAVAAAAQTASSKAADPANSFAGGAASGVSITPVAFLIITPDDVKIMPAARAATMYDEIIDRFPEILREVKKVFPQKAQKTDQQKDCAQNELVAEQKPVVK